MLRKLTCYSIQMNVYECNGKNIFMSERWNVPFNEATAELNGTFHLSPNENILTIALINIHSFIHLLFQHSFIHSFIHIYIYSTICRHACFGVLRLVSAAWYTFRYVRHSYLYPMNLLSPRHVVQHGDSTHPDMRRA